MARRGLSSSAYLRDQIAVAQRAARALLSSQERVGRAHPWPDDPPEDDLIELEALTARFARLVDLLTQRVFRAVDAQELIDDGSLIDRLNRAEQRGLIDSATRWREIRLLRNQIAHDYVLDSLRQLFEDVYGATPEVLQALESVRRFIANRT